jgi:excisionase family DNA binding protein
MEDEWYTPEELGTRLKIEVRTIQAQARKGQIPGAKKVGHQWRFKATKVDTWLNETSSPAPTRAPRIDPTKLTPASQDKLARIQQFRRT